MLLGPEQFEYVLTNRAIERRHGFITNQNFRFQNKCSCNRDALRLSARQLVWKSFLQGIVQPDSSKHRCDNFVLVSFDLVRLVNR